MIFISADQIQAQPLKILIDNEIAMCQDYQRAFVYMKLINNTSDTLYLPGIRVVQPSYPNLHAYLSFNECIKNCKLDSSLFRNNHTDIFIFTFGCNLISMLSKTNCDSLMLDCSVDEKDDYWLEMRCFEPSEFFNNTFPMHKEGLFYLSRTVKLLPYDTTMQKVLLDFTYYHLEPGYYSFRLYYHINNQDLSREFALGEVYKKFNFIKESVVSNQATVHIMNDPHVCSDLICPKAWKPPSQR